MLSGVPMSLWIKTWKLCTPLHIRKSTSMVLLGMLIYLFWGRLYGVTPSLHLMLYTVFCWSTEYGVKSSRIHKGIQHHSIHFDPWKTTISSTTQVTFLWYLWFPKGVLYIYIYLLYIYIYYIYIYYIYIFIIYIIYTSHSNDCYVQTYDSGWNLVHQRRPKLWSRWVGQTSGSHQNILVKCLRHFHLFQSYLQDDLTF